MIRFILKREVSDEHNGSHFESYFTIDDDVKALQRALCRGGRGEYGFDLCSLVGVEVIETEADVKEAASDDEPPF